MKWLLHVDKDNQACCDPLEIEGSVDLGRQDSSLAKEQAMVVNGQAPICYPLTAGITRVVVASVNEQPMLRHIQIDPLADSESFRIRNLSRHVAFHLTGGATVAPSSAVEGPSPLEFRIDRWTIRADVGGEPEESMDGIEMLDEQASPPGSKNVPGAPLSSVMQSMAVGGMDSVNLIKWLQATMDVLQEAASSREFLPRAARAVTELIHLDGCRVLLHDGERWSTAAEFNRPGVNRAGWKPSINLLEQMRQQKRTVWQVPNSSASLVNLTAVVVAPILSPTGNVIGAIYGDRGQSTAAGIPARITKLEALLAEVLARGVAAGLARLEHEQTAIRAHVQLEAHMSPALARYLLDNPDALRGRDTQVTILFVDLRKFSTNSEHLGPEATVEWIGEVMGAMSDCVQEHGGIVVDYIGDELMAMFGAPMEQPDHAQRACRAALQMLAHLPRLNEQWNARLKVPMDLGIGINSGMARVGNVGASSKMSPKVKFGALGNTTNLASRVQGATKHLKTRLLITRATKDMLDASFAVRRIGLAKVVNITEPVELYELAAATKPIWTDLQMEYEGALKKFEGGNFRTSVRVLGNLLNEHPEDGPALVLLSRAVGCMVKEPGPDFHLWELPGK